MKSSLWVRIASVCALFVAAHGDACVVSYRPAAEMQQQAQTVLVATVLAKHVSAQSAIGELYAYKIKIRKVERGYLASKVVTVTYYNMRATLRDGTITCPLKTGSGIEMGLAVGQELRFFLDSSANKEILFTELAALQKS